MSVKNDLAKASRICLSTDIWTSRAAEAYNTATVHFIDGDWSLWTGVLETASFAGSHTGVRIAERMKETATRFGLKLEQIVGFVHDEAANVELAGTLLLDSDEWETIVCAAHRLQNAVRHGLNASPAVVKLLALSRKMVGHFKHSALATNALNAKQREMQPRSEPKKVVQDVPTR